MTHTNVVFDAAVPFEEKDADGEIRRRIGEAVLEIDPKLRAVVTVDRGATDGREAKGLDFQFGLSYIIKDRGAPSRRGRQAGAREGRGFTDGGGPPAKSQEDLS